MSAQPTVYLDYNATAPVRSEVVKRVTEVLGVPGNPSSVHSAGRKARAIVEDGRRAVANLVGATPRSVVFTSGGSESNNAALRMTGAKSLFIAADGHDSLLAAGKAFASEAGGSMQLIPLLQDGSLDLAFLEQALATEAATANAAASNAGSKGAASVLVSVMAVNNETGVMQNLSAVAAVVQDFGARLHIDAVQAAGKCFIDMAVLKADYLSLSAHKLGGPQGVGALVLSDTAPLAPLVVGGGQEMGRRSGTENVAGIAGFGIAALIAGQELASGKLEHIAKLRNALEGGVERLATQYGHAVTVVAKDSERAANTSCIILPGVKSETQVMHMDLGRVCVSSGSACSSGKVKVSHVLTAMGFAAEEAMSSIRVSLGYASTEADVARFLEVYERLMARL